MSFHDFSVYCEGVADREDRIRDMLAVAVSYLVNVHLGKNASRLSPADVFGHRKKVVDETRGMGSIERMRAVQRKLDAEKAEEFWTSERGRTIMESVGDVAEDGG